MADKTLRSLVGGGGGALPQLAPDLTFPGSTEGGGTAPYYLINGIDASAGLTPLLSLTGKFMVNEMALLGLTAENITVKLTVDGVIIWNNSFVCGASLYLLGANPISGELREAIMCNESFKLEVQTTSDTSIGIYYMARPIL